MYNERDQVYTSEEKSQAWSDAAAMVQIYSDDLVARWNKEIDTYLVFAGLFSAILTAFNVQSYLLLQPAAPDPSTALLRRISEQLGSFTLGPSFINSTTPPNPSGVVGDAATPPVSRSAVWLNALWFSGLILSLASAFVGILVKQWLNEYTAGVSGTSRPAARLRQHRLNNLNIWRVERIVGAIPVLLQLALASFLAGIILLLWTLHTTVAAISSALVGVLVIFTAATTLLPLVDSTCVYLSPQVRGLAYIWRPHRAIYWACRLPLAPRCVCQTVHLRWATLPTLGNLPSSFQSAVSTHIRRPAHAIMKWLANSRAKHTPTQTWRGRERSTIWTLRHELDRQILSEAYSATLHPDAISAATVCLMDLPGKEVALYFRQLHSSAMEHFGVAEDLAYERDPFGWRNQHRSLWIHVLLCALAEPDAALSKAEMIALCVHLDNAVWHPTIRTTEVEWAVLTFWSFMDCLDDQRTRELLPYNEDQLSRTAARLIHDINTFELPTDGAIALWDVNHSYRHVRLSGERLRGASAACTDSAYRRYLHSLVWFLQPAQHVLTNKPVPSEDQPLQTARTYARDALAELGRTLARMAATETTQWYQGDEVGDADGLMDVMQRISGHVSRLATLQCVPDDLIQELHRITVLPVRTAPARDNRRPNRSPGENHCREFAILLKGAVSSLEIPP